MDLLNFLLLILAFLSGILIAIPTLILNIKFSPRFGLIEWPKARGVSEEQLPIIGHSIVILSIALLLLITLLTEVRPAFLVGSIIMAIMGFIDDKRSLSPIDKFFIQVVCVGSVILFDPLVHNNMMVKYGSWGFFWATFFILGLINAINFIDGIDGLAGLSIFIGILGCILFIPTSGNYLFYFLMLSVVAGLFLPFLFFNVIKRKGFLGNIGSYFFGYFLAVNHLSIPIEAQDSLCRISISALCFIVPVSDSVMVIMTRLFSLRSPFEADKGHMHHRLVQSGLKLRYVLFSLGIVEISSLFIGVALYRYGLSVNSPMAFYICISLIPIIIVLITLIEKTSRQRVQLYFQRLDKGEPIYFMKYVIKRPDGKAISGTMLKKLQARISAEIRVNDLCYYHEPNILFLVLRVDSLSLKVINHRLEQIFNKHKVLAILNIEEGEFVKVSRKIPKLIESKKKAS